MRRLICWLFGIRKTMNVRYFYKVTVDGLSVEFGCQTAAEMEAFINHDREGGDYIRLVWEAEPQDKP